MYLAKVLTWQLVSRLTVDAACWSTGFSLRVCSAGGDLQMDAGIAATRRIDSSVTPAGKHTASEVISMRSMKPLRFWQDH